MGRGRHRPGLRGKKESGPRGGQPQGRVQHGTLRDRELHGLPGDCGHRDPGREREHREPRRVREHRDPGQGREHRDQERGRGHRDPGGRQPVHDPGEEPTWPRPSGWR